MKRVIRLSESELNTIIKKIIVEQKIFLNERVSDPYKDPWTRDDTILSLYCTKYVKDNDTRKLGIKDLEYLANHIIGTTMHSLDSQMSNIRYLAGYKGLTDYSNFRKRNI